MWLLDYHKAVQIVLDKARPTKRSQLLPLAQALGCILADEILSDVDLPPFDRAMMDGFAVMSADVREPPVELEVIGRVGAGESILEFVVRPGCAVEIMTGAPVPPGADAVVQVEATSGFGRSRVRIDAPAKPGLSISPRAAVLAKSEPVLRLGERIDVAQTALLAAVGCDPVPVAPPLEVAVISTGDEVVPHTVSPGLSQIRDVCGPALCAAVRRLGCSPRYLGIVGDDPGATRDAVARGLECDVLILTGGVSAGARDHVAAALFESGVELHFERLAIKPGKPTVFGTRENTLVFGLPGNPVSAMVTFELFVRPACLARMGASAPRAPVWHARLTRNIRPEAKRTWFLHGRLRCPGGEPEVEPVASPNSADIVSSARGDCLIVVPPGPEEILAGRTLDVIVTGRPSNE